MRLSPLLLAGALATANAFAPNRNVFGRPNTSLNIAEGDAMPSVELYQGFPDVEKINIADYVKGKNVIIVPGYLEYEGELKEAGIDEVIVYCVNDSAVMQAWAEDQDIEDSFVTMMGDPTRELTSALDMEMNHPGPSSVGIIGRCKRFALHVNDGTVKYVTVSEGPDDPAGDDDPSSSLADALLKVVKA